MDSLVPWALEVYLGHVDHKVHPVVKVTLVSPVLLVCLGAPVNLDHEALVDRKALKVSKVIKEMLVTLVGPVCQVDLVQLAQQVFQDNQDLKVLWVQGVFPG